MSKRAAFLGLVLLLAGCGHRGNNEAFDHCQTPGFHYRTGVTSNGNKWGECVADDMADLQGQWIAVPWDLSAPEGRTRKNDLCYTADTSCDGAYSGLKPAHTDSCTCGYATITTTGSSGAGGTVRGWPWQ